MTLLVIIYLYTPKPPSYLSQTRARKVVASYFLRVILSSHCLKSHHWTIWVVLRGL